VWFFFDCDGVVGCGVEVVLLYVGVFGVFVEVCYFGVVGDVCDVGVEDVGDVGVLF